MTLLLLGMDAMTAVGVIAICGVLAADIAVRLLGPPAAGPSLPGR